MGNGIFFNFIVAIDKIQILSFSYLNARISS